MSTRMVVICFLLAAGCGAGAEVAEVEMPVEVSAAGMTPALTDLGYTVTVTGMRAALADLAFTVPGDGLVTTQSQALRGPGGAPDYGHPGHVSGGEITGELPGERVIDWMADGAALGTATLLEGDYAGVNFRFRRAHAGDGLEAGDPLLDHSVHVTGTARRDGIDVDFDAVLDIDDGYELVGAPFEHAVRAGDPARLRFELYTSESFSGSGQTLFDGIDFATLDQDGDGQVAIGPGTEAHNKLRRTVQSHDFYAVIAQ
jgi:hypothetical protein